MRPAGCGCELARQAVLALDEDERAVSAHDGPRLQAAWRCPAAGYTPAADRAELPAAHRRVLALVDALADGEDCGTTCPKAVAREPAAGAVLEARAWREHGQTRERVGWPSLALCEAIGLVDRGYADRLDWEQKHPEKKPGSGR